MKLKKTLTDKPLMVIFRTGILIIITLFLFTGFQPGKRIQNPYEHVDWSKYKPYKANLNTHTMVSNGWENPQTVVKYYRDLGYNVLAITDPGMVTYPWENFSGFRTSELTFSRIYHLVVRPLQDHSIPVQDTLFTNVSTSETGMIAIQGCKLTFDKHEVNSYFNDQECSDGNIFKDVAKKNGLMIINHPGKEIYPLRWYSDLFRSHKHLVGLEVFRSAGLYPDIRSLWDSVLTVMSPDRPVWGFANDNFLSRRDLGESWNVFWLPELNEKEVRKAMEKGSFFMVHAPLGHDGHAPPEVKSIKVDQRKGTILIHAIECDSLLWVSEGKVLGRAAQIQKNELPEECSYVRAEIYGRGKTVVFTQPFFIK